MHFIKYYSEMAVLLIILFSTLFFLPANFIKAEETVNILRIGGSGVGNYSSIQEAINISDTGDILYVHSGTYYGPILISTTISLIGEDKNTTIINGNFFNNVLQINTDKVLVQGFTIQNSGAVFPNTGINISSNFNIIKNNIIKNNFYGITIFKNSNNNILGNIIQNNDHCGIYLIGASNNTIKNNIIQFHIFNGIGMYDSSDFNNILENKISNNDYCGVNMQISSKNNISQNIISNNTNGIRIPLSKYQNLISNNIFTDNKVDIDNKTGFSIFEFIAVSLVLFLLTIFILFYKEKSRKKNNLSKDFKYTIDAIGKQCPIPLIMAKKKISKIKKGEILEIITTDFVVKENLERYGKEKHELVKIDKNGDLIKIFIKKK